MSDGSGIADRLDGSHVVLTGVTGFVGEALLLRLLADVPGVRISTLVRPKGSTPGEDRIRSLLGKPIFRDVVAQAGDVEALLAARINVIEGDMAAVPPLPADTGAVVHCAGDVSFDPPVDQGFTTNVVGTRDLLRRVGELPDGGAGVHYVHISTAYVAGRRRGSILEGPVEHDVDVDAELAWAVGQRAVVEQQSRDADRLAGFRKDAERLHRRAGMIAAATAVEKERKEWVRAEMVRLGTERARSLGWTDCYTFTKALGERVVEEWGQGPVSIVRPSIIESALVSPHPGWIEGFKMAEPLILAYGRGELPDIPAFADLTTDIVPVDHVVAATIAVLAHPPAIGEPGYFHVSSGGRNPLTFNQLYESVRGHFEEHPFEYGARGASRLPVWSFPGSSAVQRLLGTGERAHRLADRAITLAPRSDRVRELALTLDRQGRRLDFLRRYLDIYGEYLEADLRFDDARTLELYESLDEADRATFAFDTAVIEWDHYLREVHCPAVTAPIRRLDKARSRRKSSAAPGTLRALTPAGEGPDGADGSGQRVAAFFDLDGTLLSSNVIETYLWMRLQELHGTDRVGELARVAARVPSQLRADRHDRAAFLRAVYRHYEGARLSDLEAIADTSLTDHVLSRLSPSAVRRVRQHRAAGQLTVLITGAVRPITRPLAPLFDHIQAADLAVDADGRCTGDLASSPVVGDSRGAWIRTWAERNDIDLAASFGYADSYSDLPLLEAVGHPVAVRPDVQLHRHARSHQWTIVDWASTDTTARTIDPARRR